MAAEQLCIQTCCIASRSLLRLRHTTSCRDSSLRSIEPAEGPIRTMLVQDDRAWVAGGRSEPWLAVFDAVQGRHTHPLTRSIAVSVSRKQLF